MDGSSCATTLVERVSRFTGLLALPSKHAECTAGAVIEYFNELPEMMRSSLAWDQGLSSRFASAAGPWGDSR